MATIVTRAGKGSPLTHEEVDANFTNLNDEAATKAPLASPTFTGNVGIGTNSPAAQFQVSGTTTNIAQFTASITGTTMDVTAVATGTIAVGDIVYGANIAPITRITALGTGTGGVGTYTVSVSQTAASSAITYTGSPLASRIRISDTDVSSQSGQPAGSIEFFGSDTNTPGAGIGAYVSAVSEDSSPDTALTFGTRDADGGGVDANERMRITSAGNVGIGTSSPVAPINLVAGNNEHMRLQNTTAGGGSGYISFYEAGGTRVAWIGNSSSSNTNIQINNQSATGFISLNTNNTERMRITSAGNVGIGTTAPAATLDVAGTGAMKVPVGTEAQRPTSATGLLRFNSDAASFEGYNGTEWGSIGGGATSDAIYENSATIAENITIATGRNGMSTGPITVNSGVTVTVESGARYVVI